MAKKTILLLLIGFTPLLLVAQLGKGYWMASGELFIRSNDYSDDFSRETYLRLKPRLGAFVHPKLLFGGELTLESLGTDVGVGNSLFGRFYFKDYSPLYLFLGLQWSSQSNRSFLVGVPESAFFRTRTATLQLGGSYFLGAGVAIDLIFNYDFYRKFLRTNRRFNLEPNQSYFNVRLQYFWKGKKPEGEKQMSIPDSLLIQKGQWMIGGLAQIGLTTSEAPGDYEWWLGPTVGYFIRDRLAIIGGLSLGQRERKISYEFEGHVGARYYLSIRHQRFFFVEPSIAYLNSLQQISADYKYRSLHLWNYGLRVGYTKFINQRVSLDLSMAFRQYRVFSGSVGNVTFYSGAYSEYFLKSRPVNDLLFNVGLQFVL
ncbi:MAG: hypothetical protein AAFP19_12035 [Bacteroidota bacterium]